MPQRRQKLTSMCSKFGFDQPHSRDYLSKLDVGEVEGGNRGPLGTRTLPPHQIIQESAATAQRSRKSALFMTASPLPVALRWGNVRPSSCGRYSAKETARVVRDDDRSTSRMTAFAATRFIKLPPSRDQRVSRVVSDTSRGLVNQARAIATVAAASRRVRRQCGIAPPIEPDLIEQRLRTLQRPYLRFSPAAIRGTGPCVSAACPGRNKLNAGKRSRRCPRTETGSAVGWQKLQRCSEQFHSPSLGPHPGDTDKGCPCHNLRANNEGCFSPTGLRSRHAGAMHDTLLSPKCFCKRGRKYRWISFSLQTHGSPSNTAAVSNTTTRRILRRLHDDDEHDAAACKR